MSSLLKKIGLFRRKENGSATIEFVILFPAFIALFLMGFESGFYMVRSVMLERSVDIATRDIRLGNGRVPQFAALKSQICQNAVIFKDGECEDALQIQMERIAITPGGIDKMRGNYLCIDREDDADQSGDTTYDVGEENTMMVLRVCLLQSPLFPTTTLGAGLAADNLGNLTLVTTTAFVNEPGTRSFAALVSDDDDDGQFGVEEEGGEGGGSTDQSGY